MKLVPVAALGVTVTPEVAAFVVAVCVVANVTLSITSEPNKPLEVNAVLPVPVLITVP